jgi:hypothetical protein
MNKETLAKVDSNLKEARVIRDVAVRSGNINLMHKV